MADHMERLEVDVFDEGMEQQHPHYATIHRRIQESLMLARLQRSLGLQLNTEGNGRTIIVNEESIRSIGTIKLVWQRCGLTRETLFHVVEQLPFGTDLTLGDELLSLDPRILDSGESGVHVLAKDERKKTAGRMCINYHHLSCHQEPR